MLRDRPIAMRVVKHTEAENVKLAPVSVIQGDESCDECVDTFDENRQDCEA
jgi:hypothetical protein